MSSTTAVVEGGNLRIALADGRDVVSCGYMRREFGFGLPVLSGGVVGVVGW